MRQITHQISVHTQGRKLYDITPEVTAWAESVSYTHLDVYKRQVQRAVASAG